MKKKSSSQTIKKLFKEIDRQTIDSKNKQRLKQELRDHIDDMVSDRMLTSDKDEEEMREEAARQLGDSDSITRAYNESIPRKSTGELYISTVLIGMLSLGLYAAIYFFLRFAFLSIDINYPGTVNPWLLILVLVLPILYIILRNFYTSVIAKIYTESPNKRMFTNNVRVLIGIPVLVLTGSILTLLYMSQFIDTNSGVFSDVFLRQGLPGIIPLSVGTLLAFLIATNISRTGGVRRADRHTNPNILIALRIGIGILLCLSVVATSVLLRVSELPGFRPILESESLITEIASKFVWIRTLIELFLFNVPFLYTLIWSAQKILLAQQILFALLVALGVIGTTNLLFDIRRLIKSHGLSLRTIPWFRIALVLYIPSVLWYAPSGKPHIEWHVPAAEVSERIERSQTHVAYQFVKYINRMEGRLFRYEIDAFKDASLYEFGITQNTQKIFNISDIKSVDDFKIQKMDKQAAWYERERYYGIAYPEGITCSKPFDHYQYTPIDSNLAAQQIKLCQELRYNGHVILTQDEWHEIVDVKLSHDNKWALLVISPDVYDPNYVYLVDLRGLE